MNIEPLSSQSCIELLYNLDDVVASNMSADRHNLYTSTYSGWIPLLDVLLNINRENLYLDTVHPYTISYFNFYDEILNSSVTPFNNFNGAFKSHILKWSFFRYIITGETVELYVGPGIVLHKDVNGILKPLFMVCLSNSMFLDLLSGNRNCVSKSDEVKLFVDFKLLTPKYQKVYKILETLYVQPLLEKGVEMCVKPSELFMKEVLGNEFTTTIVSEEEFQEFNRIIREEVI